MLYLSAACGPPCVITASGYFWPGLIVDRIGEHALDGRAVGALPLNRFLASELEVARQVVEHVRHLLRRGRRRSRMRPDFAAARRVADREREAIAGHATSAPMLCLPSVSCFGLPPAGRHDEQLLVDAEVGEQVDRLAVAATRPRGRRRAAPSRRRQRARRRRRPGHDEQAAVVVGLESARSRREMNSTCDVVGRDRARRFPGRCSSSAAAALEPSAFGDPDFALVARCRAAASARAGRRSSGRPPTARSR